MIDVVGTIQELHDSIDQYLVREEESRKNLEEITLRLPANLEREDKREFMIVFVEVELTSL
jgi:hypothetical protein